MIREVKISDFLIERKDRFKPSEANALGLKRIEKIDFNGNIFFSEKETNTNMILVKNGDLVISGINVEKGALSVYEGENDVMATIHYSSYIFNKDEIDIQYLKWFLKSKNFRLIIEEQVSGGIKTEIKAKTFLSLKINLPDIDTQREIVKRIIKQNELYLLLVRKDNQNEGLIQSLRKAILQSAIQGELVAQDPNDEPASELLKRIKAEKEMLIKEGKIKRDKPFLPIREDEIPFDIPKNWVWCRLGEIVSILGDGIHGTPYFNDSGDYYFINGNNLDNGTIKFFGNTKKVIDSEYKKYKKELNERTIFVSINGSIGNIAFYSNEKIILGKSACYFNLFEKINKYYIKYIINSEYFLSYSLTSATGTTIKNVSLQAMRDFLLPLPSITKQQQIVEKVDKLIEYCDKLEAKVKSSKEETEKLMEAVLEQAFGGGK